MKKRLLALFVPVVVATLVAGCGGGDTVDPEPAPAAGPPDLSGTYGLVSLTQGGATVAPPLATGTFTLSQTSSSGDSASGTMTYEVSVPAVGIMLQDQGTFTIRTDGTWQQSGTEVQALGMYTLAGNVLTIIVTEPLAAASTTVWQRQ